MINFLSFCPSEIKSLFFLYFFEHLFLLASLFVFERYCDIFPLPLKNYLSVVFLVYTIFSFVSFYLEIISSIQKFPKIIMFPYTLHPPCTDYITIVHND